MRLGPAENPILPIITLTERMVVRMCVCMFVFVAPRSSTTISSAATMVDEVSSTSASVSLNLHSKRSSGTFQGHDTTKFRGYMYAHAHKCTTARPWTQTAAPASRSVYVSAYVCESVCVCVYMFCARRVCVLHFGKAITRWVQ